MNRIQISNCATKRQPQSNHFTANRLYCQVFVIFEKLVANYQKYFVHLRA